jgi:hypothetical protein
MGRAVQSIRREARWGGSLYLVIIVTALFAEMFVRSAFKVPGDAAATAGNILASPLLWRLGGAADLVNLACDAAVGVILYDLLKPVNGTLALMALAFRLVFNACLVVVTLLHFAALRLPDLVLQLLGLHAIGYNIALIFFGIHCLLIGYLIAQSRYMPRPIGWLVGIGGVCYLANSVFHLVLPAVNFPLAVLPGNAPSRDGCLFGA